MHYTAANKQSFSQEMQYFHDMRGIRLAVLFQKIN